MATLAPRATTHQAVKREVAAFGRAMLLQGLQGID